ncbi:Uu.00g080560.m01.CDS01 [Anthostomella pinea]|uniref:Uu.00g080560.m01.CDS01 n=1 Tax=Anthostomella pinea TaxID=933095 RepID=A0AAI8YJB7_9PEZI|nr:Uu.00g080560.m01.CDS01 [Anthostomella pinea]
MSFLFAYPVSRSRSTATASTICAQCRRSFQTNAVRYSGHNRWSKIKHEKGAADKKKTSQRSTFSKHLTLYSKLYGADPSLNSQLAAMIATAKKAGMPKANIDVAIARGQGKSSSGAGLEAATLEIMMSPSVALVVDIETDSKQRALHELRSIIKKHNGTVTPTAFLFARLGRTVLQQNNKDNGNSGSGDDFDEILMQALDAGAEDVEQDEDGNVVLWTQPNMTHQVAQNLSKELDKQILSSDIIWSCTSDKVKLDDAEATEGIAKLLASLRDYPDVQGIYGNPERGAVSEEIWSAVEENLDA